ncbi:MAG: hypothetical protein AMXMBFR64_32850 [Myxococcales bacterium]
MTHRIGALWLLLAVVACGSDRGCADAPPAPRREDPPPPARAEPVSIIVEAEASGSPDDVEALVAVPLESALLRIPGVEEVASTVRAGHSSSAARFRSGEDPLRAAAAVREALEGARPSFPEGTLPTVRIDTRPVPAVRLTISGAHPSDRSLAEEVSRPALLTLPGVAEVALCGGHSARITVRADPRRLEALGLEAAAVRDALRSALLAASPLVPPSAGPGDLGDVAVGAARVRDVATIAEELIPLPCMAADPRGAVVLVTVLAREDQAEAVTESVAQRIDGLALPPDAVVLALPHDPTVLELDLPPDVEPSAALATMRSIAAEAGPWVGTLQTPDRATLLLWTGRPGADATRDPLAAALRTPGVTVRQSSGAALVLRLTGADAEGVVAAARALAEAPRPAGVLAVAALDVGEAPVIRVKPDHAAIAAHGLTIQDVLEAAHPEGVRVGAVRQGSRFIDVVLLPVEAPTDARLRAHDGAAVPLTSVATMELVTERTTRRRVDGRPMADVVFHLEVGADAEAVRRSVKVEALGVEARWVTR